MPDDPERSVYYDILTTVRNRIQDAGLIGIDRSRIYLEPAGSDQGKELPAIVVMPGNPETIDPAAGNNGQDEIQYVILVAIVTAKDSRDHGLFKLALNWREVIRKLFSTQRIPEVAEVTRTQVEPQAVIDPAFWFQHAKLLSALQIRAFSLEALGPLT